MESGRPTGTVVPYWRWLGQQSETLGCVPSSPLPLIRNGTRPWAEPSLAAESHTDSRLAGSERLHLAQISFKLNSEQSHRFRFAPHNSFLCATLILSHGKVEVWPSAWQQGVFLRDASQPASARLHRLNVHSREERLGFDCWSAN